MSEEGTISIAGLDKAEVLAALYNGSAQFGMGIVHARGRDGMTVEQARDVIEGKSAKSMPPWEAEDAQRLRFDYLFGRVLKVNLSEDTFRTALYNRDIGRGAAERIIADLRASKAVAA